MDTAIKREDGMEAEDWKAMYLILVRGICGAVEQIGREADQAVIATLTDALRKAEEYYIEVPEGRNGMAAGGKKEPETQPNFPEKNYEKRRKSS